MERRVLPVAQPAAVGRGRGSGGVLVASVLDDHSHEWRKLPDAVGLFCCTDRRCLWCAVCPGCLGSLDVAIRARDGVVGMALYWCPAHQGGGLYDSQS
jgi:hypothetical protein